jgi:hypothetical protein
VDDFDEESVDELEDYLLVALFLEVYFFKLNDEVFEVASDEDEDDDS